MALLGAGATGEARKAAEEAVATDPESEWPYRVLAVVLIRCGKTRGALAAAQQAVQLGPAVPAAQLVLGQAQLAAKKKRGAHETALRLREMAPDFVHSHTLLGDVERTCKRPEAAAEHYREALRLEPTSEEVLISLGVVLLRSGHTQEAIDRFHDALRINPASTVAQRDLEIAVMQHVNPIWLRRLYRRPIALLLWIVPPLRLISGSILLINILVNRLHRGQKLQGQHPAVEMFFRRGARGRLWRTRSRFGKVIIVSMGTLLAVLGIMIFLTAVVNIL